MIIRTIHDATIDFLEEKIVLLTGPRQVGKTFFTKSLMHSFEYLNFDHADGRAIIKQMSWDRSKELIVLDEIHKMKNWKRWLKGIYDVDGIPPALLATGSARMDVYRKGGDSLAGRHYLLRLLPLSIKEVDAKHPKEVLEALMQFGGFPEPFLSGSTRKSKLWRKGHLDIILREDLLDLEKVRDIKSIELLVDLLAARVGSSISYASLAQDLQVSPHTIKHWIEILENLYVIFVVRPYSKKLSKSIRKETKIYFHDVARVTAEAGARLENIVACHLLKRNYFLSDTEGEKMQLFYLRDKEKREIDFLTTRNDQVEWLIEVKTGEKNLSNHLKYYHERLLPKNSYQLVYNLNRTSEFPNGIRIVPVDDFLAKLET